MARVGRSYANRAVVVCGGPAAPPLLDLVGSGGAIVGGSAGLRSNPAISLVGSGGAIVGGWATIQATVSSVGSGGISLGGSARIDVIVAKAGTGGVTIGGHATVSVVVNAGHRVGVVVNPAAVLKLPEVLADVEGDLDVGIGGAGLIQATIGRSVIQAGARRFAFRYELLDQDNRRRGDLDTVVDCTVSQDWLADIKRKADITLRDGGELPIDWMSDRIRPWVRLLLPPYGDDDWVEWPQGAFLLSSPTRSTDAAGTVWRHVSGFDQLQVLADDKVADRYAVTAGTAYTDAVAVLLGGSPATVTASASTLPVAREWDPGTSRLRIVNDLLGAINYQSLSYDEYGRAVVQPYVTPSSRPEEHVYADDESSLLLPQVDQELDLFGVANRWVLVVSNPDQGAIVGEYLNQDPASPTSTVRRGRTITDFRTEQDAADQVTLEAKAKRLAFEASQVYEALTFTTGLMPFHSGNDLYRIVFMPLGVNSSFVETSWSMPMKIGAAMQHKARRVVAVGGAN